MAHKTTVVVDGSNVITANIGEETYFRVQRIINVINKLKKLGYTYKVGMKAKTYNYIIKYAPEEKISEADKGTLTELVEKLEISLLNKDADDHWLHLGAIEFDAATGSWGTISHIGIFDAASSGNLIAHSSLSASKAIGTGDVFRIPAGDIDITLD